MVRRASARTPAWPKTLPARMVGGARRHTTVPAVADRPAVARARAPSPPAHFPAGETWVRPGGAGVRAILFNSRACSSQERTEAKGTQTLLLPPPHHTPQTERQEDTQRKSEWTGAQPTGHADGGRGESYWRRGRVATTACDGAGLGCSPRGAPPHPTHPLPGCGGRRRPADGRPPGRL